MTAKVKLIKKEDRNGPVSPVEAEAGADPKEWSTAVKSWVKEFQDDRRDGSPRLSTACLATQRRNLDAPSLLENTSPAIANQKTDVASLSNRTKLKKTQPYMR